MMIQAGNRVAALALLWSAVAIDPIDLASHRRLAATLAHGGDFEAAAEEYARYIEFLLPIGEVGRAALELQYGASTLGGRHALHAAAEKIVAAHRHGYRAARTSVRASAGSAASVAHHGTGRSGHGGGAVRGTTSSSESSISLLRPRRRRSPLDAARGWHI
jgi:hypothetical protein